VPDEPTSPNGPPSEPGFADRYGNYLVGVGHGLKDSVMGIVDLVSESAKIAWDVATDEPYAREAAWETAKSMIKDANTLLNPLASPEDKAELGGRIIDGAKDMVKGVEQKLDREAEEGGGEQAIGYVVGVLLFAKLVEKCGGERGPKGPVENPAAVAESEALAGETASETVDLYHGSKDNFTNINKNGLNPNYDGPTYTSTDSAAADNALQHHQSFDQAPDPGVVKSSIPKAEYDALVESGDISVNDNYQGFGGGMDTNEVKLNTPKAKETFNKHMKP
jgi:hypothetical protein